MAKPETLETLSVLLRGLRAAVAPSAPYIEPLWGDVRGPLFTLRVVADPHMVVVVPRADFSRMDRVRMWFEGIVDRAELTREVFPWPRVVRSFIRPSTEVVQMGGVLYCHTAVADRLRREVARG